VRNQPTRGHRLAFSLLEAQVAFVILGIALTGLYPLVIVYSRQLQKIEGRYKPGTTYYLTPSTDPWTRKLGAAATLTLQPAAIPASAPVLVIDNVDGGYTESGTGWQNETSIKAFQGMGRTHPMGSGTNVATWQFTGLQPGWYNVLATWPVGGTQASNAPYVIYDGTISRGTFTADQTQPPIGAVSQGQTWQSLAVVAIRGTSLRVALSDQANGIVVADAIRIIPVRNLVQVTGLNRTLTGDDVTAQASLTVVTPQ
jgi:hypothetical protein